MPELNLACSRFLEVKSLVFNCLCVSVLALRIKLTVFLKLLYSWFYYYERAVDLFYSFSYCFAEKQLKAFKIVIFSLFFYSFLLLS